MPAVQAEYIVQWVGIWVDRDRGYRHRPEWFFVWLGGIGTAIAVLLPFTQHLPAALATATVNLGLGLTIIGLVRHTAAAGVRLRGVARAGIGPAHQLRRRIMSPHRQKQTAIPISGCSKDLAGHRPVWVGNYRGVGALRLRRYSYRGTGCSPFQFTH